MKAVLRALAVLVVIAGVAGGISVYAIVRRGLSTRTEPSRVEELIARSPGGQQPACARQPRSATHARPAPQKHTTPHHTRT